MACNVREVIAEIGALPSVGQYQLGLAIYGMLCRILQNFDPVADCSITASLAELGCCDKPSPYDLLRAVFGKLCQIETAIQEGGSSTATCLTASDVDPVADPGCELAFHHNRITRMVWEWNGTTWVEFLGL